MQLSMWWCSSWCAGDDPFTLFPLYNFLPGNIPSASVLFPSLFGNGPHRTLMLVRWSFIYIKKAGFSVSQPIHRQPYGVSTCCTGNRALGIVSRSQKTESAPISWSTNNIVYTLYILHWPCQNLLQSNVHVHVWLLVIWGPHINADPIPSTTTRNLTFHKLYFLKSIV